MKKYIFAIIVFILMFFINRYQLNVCNFNQIELPIKEALEYCNNEKNCWTNSPIFTLKQDEIEKLDKINYKAKIIVKKNKFIDFKEYSHAKYFTYFISLINILCFIYLYFFLIKIFKIQPFKKSEEKISIKDLLLLSFIPFSKILYIAINNIENGISFKIVFIILAISILIFILLNKFLSLITKNQAFSLVLSLIVFVGYFAVDSCFIEKMFSNLFYAIIPLAGFIYLLSIPQSSLNNLINFIKKVTVIFLLFFITNLFINVYKTKIYPKIHKIGSKTTLKTTKNPTRDIYFILLDMYAGKDILEYYNFDNSKFYNSLKNKNFFTLENTSSNYNKTVFTLSTILNFKYLEDLNFYTSDIAINNSSLFQLAKQAGYTIYYNNFSDMVKAEKGYIDYPINKQSNTQNQRDIATLDLLLDEFNISIFKPTIKTQTPIELSEIIYTGSFNSDKKLVFIHLLAPHNPYIFDKKGNFIYEDDIHLDNYYKKFNSKAYLEYLEYTNDKVLKFINYIDKNSKNKPIIVLFGDHGIRQKYNMLEDYSHFDEYIKDEMFLKAHFNTFIAYRNPDLKENILNNNETLINHFIAITNDIFGTNIEKVENKKMYLDYLVKIFINEAIEKQKILK